MLPHTACQRIASSIRRNIPLRIRSFLDEIAAKYEFQSGNMHSFWEGVLTSTQIPMPKISFANTGLNAFPLIKKVNIQNTTNAQDESFEGKTGHIIPSTPNQTRKKQLTNINYYLEWPIYS